MALIHVNFFSKTLGMCTSMDVILPQRFYGFETEKSQEQDDDYPVLYLLHGASDDHTIWQRYTSIERYAAPLGLAVVMPFASLSSYTNMVYGFPYFDYIAVELPQVCREFFPKISSKREKNFIAGLSMGCYGALKIGLSYPENYAAIGAFSNGNSIFNRNIPAFFNVKRRNKLNFGVEDGSALRGTKHDLYWLAEEAVRSSKQLPRIFHACGTDDFTYDNALEFKEFMESIPGNPFSYEFHEVPGGRHTWEFWDEWIQKFLLSLKMNELRKEE